jgi:rSAM/selenodomain-associated transferase 2
MPAGPTAISVVIPVLNEVATLGACVANIRALEADVEIIVVDGGSTDGTLAFAQDLGVRVVTAAQGRGSQLRAGALAAQGEIFWFLHADTAPPPEALREIRAALAVPGAVGGHFEVAFTSRSRQARFLTWFYDTVRPLGLCYGDAAFFAGRAAYEAAGGFNPIPIFEDLDLLRRLRRQGRFVRLHSRVTTSSRRFDGPGRRFSLVFARWCFMQTLYWLGVSPHQIGRLYLPVR